MSSIKVSEKQMLAIPCPTCGAGPAEKCELRTGQPRKIPHRDRRWQALWGFPRRERKTGMSLHLSDSLPSLRLTYPGDVFNEYRVRQSCVEFRSTTHGEWRVLDESAVQLHFVFRTEVAKWLKGQSANGHGIDAITGNVDAPRDS
jgi:hypothetical protein